jgi:hypothetical protein
MTYTEAELIRAAGTLPWLQRVFDHAGKPPWTRELLVNAGSAAGNLNSLRALLDKIDQDREPPIVNRDDILTYGELESYFDRQKIYSGYGKLSVDDIAQDIGAHREKLLDHRVYRDKLGYYYRWNAGQGNWEAFGSGVHVRKEIPDRPLELLP